MMILAFSLILCLVSSVLSAVTGGFVKKVKDRCPELESDAKGTETWGKVCMWCAILFALAAGVSGFMLSRESRRGDSIAPIPAPDDTAS